MNKLIKHAQPQKKYNFDGSLKHQHEQDYNYLLLKNHRTDFVTQTL